MRWQIYHKAAQDMEAKLQAVALEHNRLFEQLRDLNAVIDTKRGDYKTQQHLLDKIQADYYNAVAEVSSLEQTIKFNETSHEEALQEIKRSQEQADQSHTEIEADLQALETIKQAILEAEAALETATDREQETTQIYREFQHQKNTWQEQWETYRTESAKFREQAEIQRVKISQLDSLNQQLQSRMDKLNGESSELSANEFQSEIEALAETIDIAWKLNVPTSTNNLSYVGNKSMNYVNKSSNLKTTCTAIVLKFSM